MLSYPNDFANQVKELYPNRTMLHAWLDTGSAEVGRFLREHENDSEENRKLFEDWKNIFKAKMYYKA